MIIDKPDSFTSKIESAIPFSLSVFLVVVSAAPAPRAPVRPPRPAPPGQRRQAGAGQGRQAEEGISFKEEVGQPRQVM